MYESDWGLKKAGRRRAVRRVSSVCADYSLPMTTRSVKGVTEEGCVPEMDIVMKRLPLEQRERLEQTI